MGYFKFKLINQMIPPTLTFLSDIDDWSEKYLAIMEFGKTLVPLNEKLKTNENKINGCQSRVWLNLRIENTLVQINGEADSRLVQGLLAIIIEIYKNKAPKQISEMDESWISDLGLDKNISMIRRSGMNAIIKNIKSRLKNLEA
jgi:cysteine desulfuration protein SufE